MDEIQNKNSSEIRRFFRNFWNFLKVVYSFENISLFSFNQLFILSLDFLQFLFDFLIMTCFYSWCNKLIYFKYWLKIDDDFSFRKRWKNT